MTKRIQQGRATIVDVSRALGLAPSTVSNAIHGKRQVSEATRRRVLEACAAMGYEASPVARALRAGRSFSIGVLLPEFSNPVFSDIIRGVEEGLADESITVLLSNTDGDERRQLSALQAFLRRQVDGLILISQQFPPDLVELLAGGPPTVLINRRDAALDLDYVGIDNVGAVEAAVGHLAERKHRRIGFVTGPLASSAAVERCDGYRAAVAKLGLDPDPTLVVEGDYSLTSGYRAGRALLSLENRPTAILASNDVMALGVMDVATKMRLTIPDDLSVVGFDDIFVSALPMIGLTTMRQPSLQLGFQAARLLNARMDDPDAAEAPRAVILPADLIVRRTTAERNGSPRAAAGLSESALTKYLTSRWKADQQTQGV